MPLLVKWPKKVSIKTLEPSILKKPKDKAFEKTSVYFLYIPLAIRDEQQNMSRRAASMPISERREQEYMETTHRVCMGFLRTTQGPGLNKLSETTTHIFIGGWEVGCNPRLLKENGIEAILYLGKQSKPDSLHKSYKKRKMEYMEINVEDSPHTNILEFIEKCYQYVHKFVQQEKKVLIHCVGGVSISAAVVLYYLLKRYYVTNFMKTRNGTKDLIDLRVYSLPRIIQFVKECRSCIDPNHNFIKQLVMVEHGMKKHYLELLRTEARKYFSEKRKSKKPKDPDNPDGDDSSSESEDENPYGDEEKDGMIDHYIDCIFDEREAAEETPRKKKSSKSNKSSKSGKSIVDDPEDPEDPEDPDLYGAKKAKKKKATVANSKSGKLSNPEPTKRKVVFREHDKLEDMKNIEHSEDEEPVKKKPAESDSDDSDESESKDVDPDPKDLASSDSD